jgi:hypothetical protein
MTWGGGLSRSKVRLTYARLNQALIDKKRKNRGYTDKLLVGPNAEVYRGDDETIILRLHSTEIVTFYPDGRCRITMGAWNTPLTKHWVDQVPSIGSIYNVKPNKWTPSITMYGRVNPVKYHNGMMVDAEGTFIGTPPSLTKNVPNAEALALRKQLLTAYKERYLPHLNMMSAKGGRCLENGTLHAPDLDDMLSSKSDEYAVCDAAVRSTAYYDSAWSQAHKLFKGWMDPAYVNAVKRRELLDEVPYVYTPKER